MTLRSPDMIPVFPAAFVSRLFEAALCFFFVFLRCK